MEDAAARSSWQAAGKQHLFAYYLSTLIHWWINSETQSPCSSPTSRCNESPLQGIKQGSLLLHQIFPQTGKEKRSISSLQTVLVSSEGASWLFAYSIRKQGQLVDWDRHSKTLMFFPLSSLACFMLSLTMRAPVKADRCPLISEGLLGHPEHSAWQKQKSWRNWMALWSGKRPQMFISRWLVENWGTSLWPPWSGHLLIIVWDAVGPKANYRSHTHASGEQISPS